MILKINDVIHNLDLAEQIYFISNATAPTGEPNAGKKSFLLRIKYPSHSFDFYGDNAIRIKNELMAYFNDFKQGLPFINLDEE